MGWDEGSEWFYVGMVIAPAGVPAATDAIRARLAGDRPNAVRYARQALEADRFANAERAAGRMARRSNVTGNAWSGWYEAITGQPSGW